VCGGVRRGAGEVGALWDELRSLGWPVVAFESPRRLPASLVSRASALPGREGAVCRELTKRFEEIVRGPVEEVAARFSEAPKGEITLVVGPAAGGSGRRATDEARRAVADLVAAGTPRKTAAEVVARLRGLPPHQLYRSPL